MPWDIICDEIKQNYMKNMFAKISKKSSEFRRMF